MATRTVARGLRSRLQRVTEAIRERRGGKGQLAQLEDEREVREYVEGQIQDGMRRGEFENLAGRGKRQAQRPPPPGVDHATFQAYGLLQRHGLKPPWIELMQEVDREKARVRALLRATCGRGAHARAEALRELRSQMDAVNKRVDLFNLSKPERLDSVFRLRLRWTDELKAALRDTRRVRIGGGGGGGEDAAQSSRRGSVM